MLKAFLKNLRDQRRSKIVSRYYDFVNAFSSLSPELVPTLPAGGRVVLFSPHCDDESLGCGGILYKHRRAGHPVTVVFMTDGSKCQSALSREEIIRLRKEEARQAARVLGVDDLVFLENPDRELIADEKTVRRASDILAEKKPDIVYLPFYLDNHPDHRQTAAVGLEALKRQSGPDAYFYEVWSAMIHDHLVDIGDAVEKKREAIRVYQSQKDIETFAEQVIGLNRFRSLGSDNQFEYAEALFKLDPNRIDEILNQIHDR